MVLFLLFNYGTLKNVCKALEYKMIFITRLFFTKSSFSDILWNVNKFVVFSLKQISSISLFIVRLYLSQLVSQNAENNLYTKCRK